MDLVLLQNPQQLKGFCVAGGVEYRGFQVGYHGLPPVAGGVEVLLVDKAHDVVHRLVVDGDAGVACLSEEGGQLLHGALLVGGGEVHPGGEQVGHLQVVEGNGVADQVALVLVQAALGLGLVHHAHQLLLGDAVVPPGPEDLAHQPLPLAEQKVQRGEEHHEQLEQRLGEHGEVLRALLGQALGGDLPEDQNDDGEGHRGHRGAVLVEPPGAQHGGHGGGGDVDNVVADEDGGQQLVILLRQGQGFDRTAAAVVRPVLQADAVE